MLLLPSERRKRPDLTRLTNPTKGRRRVHTTLEFGAPTLVALFTMAAQENVLSEVKASELKEAFSLFDKDNEGEITPAKLGAVMRSLAPDLNPTQSELEELIAEVDRQNGGEKLGFKDFLAFMTERIANSDPAEEIAEAFKVFDTTNAGKISGDDLGTVMENLGESLTQQEVEAMIRQNDTTGDGCINFQEFEKLMRQNAE